MSIEDTFTEMRKDLQLVNNLTSQDTVKQTRQFTILEAVKTKDPLYRKEKKIYHIRKQNSFHKGINTSPGGS